MEDTYLGQIVLLPYSFTPRNYVICQGQLLSISQYQALYSLIGPQFGGDARNTFALPDLRNASPISGMAYYICTSGLYPSRS